jgi:predicted enzyme related to lactoylglutathione lyase
MSNSSAAERLPGDVKAESGNLSKAGGMAKQTPGRLRANRRYKGVRTMANKQGDFIWYELMTNDADAAQAFYRTLLGWTFRDSGQEGADYRLFSAQDEGVGGVLSLSDEMKAGGARPCWLGYIAVDDVDASARAIRDAGGSIHRQPWAIPVLAASPSSPTRRACRSTS